MFDFEQRRWKPWSAEVPRVRRRRPTASSRRSSCPTSDTVRSTWLLDSVVMVKGAMLFVGESGTAKTTVIAKYLLSRNPDQYTSLGINFSSRTSSMDVQIAIEDSIEKRTKDTFGPPAGGKRLLVFVDDLNMPRVDTYGTQQPIALLKLVIDKGFLYDRGKDLTIKYIKDMQFIAAMVPGRNDVDPRFVRLFNTFASPSRPRSRSRASTDDPRTFFNDGRLQAELQGDDFEQAHRAAMEIFNAIVAALPPTPAKFHYIFNLRDLSRITEGVHARHARQVHDSTTPSCACCATSCCASSSTASSTTPTRRSCRARSRRSSRRTLPTRPTRARSPKPILFGDFLLYNEIDDGEWRRPGGGDLVRLYEDMQTTARSSPSSRRCSRSTTVHKAMNLVLFDDCLDHLVRVHRLMRLPRGNALLVGVGGSGKQSITRSPRSPPGVDVFTITLTRGYNEQLFREDLKALYQHAGDEADRLLLLRRSRGGGGLPRADQQHAHLRHGARALRGVGEGRRSSATSATRPSRRANALDTKEGVWNYYVGKCRDNLHVVLAMSPVGETLRVRCRSFPGMVNNTVIDWFVPWPEQALLSVAGVFLAEEDLPDDARRRSSAHGDGAQQRALRVGALRAAAQAVQLRDAEELPRLHLQLPLGAQGRAAEDRLS